MTTPSDTATTDTENPTPGGTPEPDVTPAPTDTDVSETPVPDAPEPTDDDVEQGSPNSEAAKRRRQLRETQTELAAVRDRLTGYQRRAAELAIGDVLATPADLFDVGHADLADYLDGNGDILTDELLTAATNLVEQRPQLGKNYTPPWPAGADFGNGVRSQSAPSGASWSSVLSDQRNRQ